jgi:hypothetical protein
MEGLLPRQDARVGRRVRCWSLHSGRNARTARQGYHQFCIVNGLYRMLVLLVIESLSKYNETKEKLLQSGYLAAMVYASVKAGELRGQVISFQTLD